MGCRAPGPTTGVRHRLRPKGDFALPLETHDQELVAPLDPATGVSSPADDHGAFRCPLDPIRPPTHGPDREEWERSAQGLHGYGDTMTPKDREPTISVRLPLGGRTDLDARARAAGKTRNAYIVEAALGSSPSKRRPVPSVQQRMFGLIVARAARAKDLGKQLAAVDESPALGEFLQLLDDIGSCAFIGLGKDP